MDSEQLMLFASAKYSLYKKTAVTAYFSSKQLLLFAFTQSEPVTTPRYGVLVGVEHNTDCVK